MYDFPNQKSVLLPHACQHAIYIEHTRTLPMAQSFETKLRRSPPRSWKAIYAVRSHDHKSHQQSVASSPAHQWLALRSEIQTTDDEKESIELHRWQGGLGCPQHQSIHDGIDGSEGILLHTNCYTEFMMPITYLALLIQESIFLEFNIKVPGSYRVGFAQQLDNDIYPCFTVWTLVVELIMVMDVELTIVSLRFKSFEIGTS